MRGFAVRRRSRRRLLPGLLAGLGLSLVLAPPAAAGQYVVAQCHAANVNSEASISGASRGDYAMRDECGRAPDQALKVVVNSSAPAGHAGYWYWQAPAGTQIVGVELEAKLRRELGHKARLYVADAAGRPVTQFASGGDGPTDFERASWRAAAGAGGVNRFYAALVCDNDGASCRESTQAKTFVRNVEVTLRDVVSPIVALRDGDLGGWQREEIGVTVGLRDAGGGVRARYVSVNGEAALNARTFACAQIGFTAMVSTMVPCARTTVPEAMRLDTSQAPFRDGANDLGICAADLSSAGNPNTGCTRAMIMVDNTRPSVAFLGQLSDDPELIRAAASDATSGLAAGSPAIEYRRVGSGAWTTLRTELVNGQLRARVDSESEPAGEYELRATVADVAGNQTTTGLRGDGSPMRLQFPLTERADLDAFFTGGAVERSVRYREPAEVRGYLRDVDGAPIVGEPVVVRQRFDEGSLARRREATVVTDRRGAFRAAVPGGPSRTIAVSYAGNRRYRDDLAPQLDLDVGSLVRLKADRRVKAGEAARFRGRVGRFFARVPAGGKLVELQYKRKPKTWNTAKEAQGTSERGSIRIPYRFRRYYEEPVTFVFRLKVTQEAAWPYRLPANSKPVEVTVVPRKR